MSQSTTNPSNHYPKLNIDSLKIYAKEWLGMFNEIPIKKIILYKYKYKKNKKIFPGAKYAVFFEVDGSYGDLRPFNSELCSFDTLGIDEDFSELVYKQAPPQNFGDEWLFFAKHSSDLDWLEKASSFGVRKEFPPIVLFRDESAWLKTPSKAPLIKRDELRERQIWKKCVQPILDKHGLKAEYQFAEGSFTEVDVHKMTCRAVNFCNSVPFDDIFHVMRMLDKGMEEYQGPNGKMKPLKNLFLYFLDKIVEDKTLPHFLELLSRRDIFDFPPPLEIERDRDKERGIWDKRFKPLVERYGLMNPFGEPYDYKYFEHPKIITQRDIDLMRRETMAECYEFPESEEEDTYNFIDMVLWNLYKDKEVSGIDLKDKLCKFLDKLFKDKKLPVFLAFFELEYAESAYAKSDIDVDYNDKQKSPARKIQDLMVKAKPELERLHQTLLKKVTFSGYIEDREKKFQEAALNGFKEKSNEFQFVKLEYLEDKSLYDFYRAGHERGDFIGKLLQKIIIANGLGVHGVQRCYKIYKDTLKPKTDTD